MPYTFNNDEVFEHEFVNPTYIPVQKNEFDNIHIYITTEDGELIQFEAGPFKANLHFRQRI